MCSYGRRYNFHDADDDAIGEILKKTSQFLRNFGSAVIEIECKSISRIRKFDWMLIDLLVRYCSGTLVALTLQFIRLDRSSAVWRPLMSNLRKFHYKGNSMPSSSLSWLTEIEDLKIDAEDFFLNDLLACSFKNLRCISLNRVDVSFGSYNFPMFLEKNRFLKEINLERLRIAHVTDLFGNQSSQIEKLSLLMDCGRSQRIGFRKLANLNSLALCIPAKAEIEEAIREIVSADIPLKHLTLHSILMNGSAEYESLCDAVSKLVHLETLNLENPYYMDDITNERTQLKCLTELVIDIGRVEMELVGVDKIVEYASCFHNLQKMVFGFVPNPDFEANVIVFDSEVFDKIVTVLQRRQNRMPLHIELTRAIYKLNVSIEWMKLHRHILTVSVSD